MDNQIAVVVKMDKKNLNWTYFLIKSKPGMYKEGYKGSVVQVRLTILKQILLIKKIDQKI
jgi:hypothetical protein